MWMRLLLVSVSIICCGVLISCERQQNNETTQAPAILVKIPGSEFNQVKLTPDAVQRVGIELIVLKEVQVLMPNGISAANPALSNTQPAPTSQPMLVKFKEVPYSAIIYGLHGETWVYILTQPLTFVRSPVSIHHIEGDVVYLLEGPAVNTQVVSVGATELYGSEYIGNIEPS